MRLHDLVFKAAEQFPDQIALQEAAGMALTYQSLSQRLRQVSSFLKAQGLRRYERVAIYLPKCLPVVEMLLACSHLGATFVIINPSLKAKQVEHILTDCSVRFLLTDTSRLTRLQSSCKSLLSMEKIFLLGELAEDSIEVPQTLVPWQSSDLASVADDESPAVAEDLATIFYTSGSTGKPKGVMISHHNLVIGADSVANYLQNDHHDKLLALLPFGFDYGFNQLTTAFKVGATCILHEHFSMQDTLRKMQQFQVTGLAAIPSIWVQLAACDWPAGVTNHLRYLTNSGGRMPVATVQQLTNLLPNTQIFLMYGLTEAFRSTYLSPENINTHQNSIGKAIPNAEIAILNHEGLLCEPLEVGELVHWGPLVTQGYWNDREKTNKRFKPLPSKLFVGAEHITAVWSGDQAYQDEHGFIYFVGRQDDMIKSSGYRISPEEIEEEIYASGQAEQVAVFAVPDAVKGQQILAAVVPKNLANFSAEKIYKSCQQNLPSYMWPAKILSIKSLPLNANGKFDRKALAAQYQNEQS